MILPKYLGALSKQTQQVCGGGGMGTEYDGPACYAEALLFNWCTRLSLELLLCMCSDVIQKISLPTPE